MENYIYTCGLRGGMETYIYTCGLRGGMETYIYTCGLRGGMETYMYTVTIYDVKSTAITILGIMEFTVDNTIRI